MFFPLLPAACSYGFPAAVLEQTHLAKQQTTLTHKFSIYIKKKLLNKPK